MGPWPQTDMWHILTREHCALPHRRNSGAHVVVLSPSHPPLWFVGPLAWEYGSNPKYGTVCVWSKTHRCTKLICGSEKFPYWPGKDECLAHKEEFSGWHRVYGL